MSGADEIVEDDRPPSARQIDRAERSKEILSTAGVPMYWGPLLVEDDDHIELRSPIEVARRTLVLWIVARTAKNRLKREPATSLL